MDFQSLSQEIANRLQVIPPEWNSQFAVLELSKDCYPGWEQSEWLDFYFRYLCEKYLPDLVPMREKVCGTTFFDGINDLSPDFGEETPANSQEKQGLFPNEEFTLAYSNYQHWRQIEWVESYFSYLCAKQLSGYFKIPGPKYKKKSFAGFLEIPWLFKVLIENTGNKNIILADSDLMVKGISKYEQIGIIFAEGTVKYLKEEKNRKTKGENIFSSQIEKIDKNLRQHSMFILKSIRFFPFTIDIMQKCETFQTTNTRIKGNLPERVLLDIVDIKEKTVYLQKYS